MLFPANLPESSVEARPAAHHGRRDRRGPRAGRAAAVGREFLDRSVHDARALNEFEVPVLGEIPRIPG